MVMRLSSSTVTFCVASSAPAFILMVYSPGSARGPRGPKPNPAAMASCCSGVGSAGGFARRSQLVRFTPAAPGPSNSRTTFPSLSSTAILTLPSFFSAASTLASLLGLCSAASVRSPLFLAGAPAALAKEPRGGRARREKHEGRVGHVCVHFFKRRQVVENPDGAAVGPEHEIVVAELNFVSANSRLLLRRGSRMA